MKKILKRTSKKKKGHESKVDSHTITFKIIFLLSPQFHSSYFLKGLTYTIPFKPPPHSHPFASSFSTPSHSLRKQKQQKGTLHVLITRYTWTCVHIQGLLCMVEMFQLLQGPNFFFIFFPFLFLSRLDAISSHLFNWLLSPLQSPHLLLTFKGRSP